MRIPGFCILNYQTNSQHNQNSQNSQNSQNNQTSKQPKMSQTEHASGNADVLVAYEAMLAQRASDDAAHETLLAQRTSAAGDGLPADKEESISLTKVQEKVESQEIQIKTLTDELAALKALFENTGLNQVPGDDEATQWFNGDVVSLNDFADAGEDDITVPKEESWESWMSLAAECAAIARARSVPVPVPVPALDMKVAVDLTNWNEYILHVCKDGAMREATEICNMIKSMDTHPWVSDAKTPEASCSTMCLRLVRSNKLRRTVDKPMKYYV